MTDQYVRDPFSDKSSNNKRQMNQKQSKRTQRYRSTAKSRIPTMSVGDVRYSFCQLRAAGDNLNPDFVLYNGQKAGAFALAYLIETTNTTRKRRRKQKKGYLSSSDSDDNSDSEKSTVKMPPSQLQKVKESDSVSRFVDFSA